MTIHEADDVLGIDANKLRVGAKPRLLQVCKDLAGEQTAIFRSLTGTNAPDVPASAVATDHTHDGTTGAIIPIPTMHCRANINLQHQTASGTDQWAPVIETPFRPPPGCTKMRWIGFTTSPQTVDDIRCGTVTTSRVQATGFEGRPVIPDYWIDRFKGRGGLWPMVHEFNVTADAVNIFRLNGWDAYYKRGTNDNEILAGPRNIDSWLLMPVVGPGATPEANPYNPGQWLTNTDVFVPESTTHLGTDRFTTFDDAMFDDHRAVSGHMVHSLLYNDALLWELLTNTIAGQNAARTVHGHNHRGSTTDLNGSGPEMDQPLGAWCYGVGRRRPGGAGAFIAVDEPSGVNRLEWSGKIHSPTPSASGEHIFGEHRVRLPAAEDGNVTSGSTKLKVAVWLHIEDQAKSGTVTIRANMLDKDGASASTQVSATAATTGAHLVTLNNVLASSTVGDGELQTLRLSIEQSGVSFPAVGVYGSCMWYEA